MEKVSLMEIVKGLKNCCLERGQSGYQLFGTGTE